MEFDPLEEITMPDLQQGLQQALQSETTEVDPEQLEESQGFDAAKISDALSNLYPEVQVQDEPPPQLTQTEPAGPTEQEKMREDMYLKDPRTESGKNESVGFVDTTLDILGAPGRGLNDYFLDEINKLPGVNLRKSPQYENGVAQSIRDLSSMILPFLMLRKGAKMGVGAATSRGPAAAVAKRFPSTSRAGKWMAELGVDTGVGAYVDSTNKLNAVDDNLAGYFKKSWPQTYRWIPSDWATLDGESPDVWAEKNRNEGIMLGMGSSFLEAFVKLGRAIRGTRSVTDYVFKDESAAKAFARAEETDPQEFMANMDAAAAKTEQALDEIGQLALTKNPMPEDATKGVHDVFHPDEVGVRSVDDMGVVGAAVDQVRIQNNAGTVHGRLRSMVSEAALKYGLEADQLPKRTIIEAVQEQIRKAGEYDAFLPDGAKIGFDEIDAAGTRIAELLTDPQADPGWLRLMLNEFKEEYTRLGKKTAVLTDEGVNAGMKAIKKYLDEYVNMDAEKARAYLVNSLAGQVSDIAEQARNMEGTLAVQQAQERIFDRLTYLVMETGLAKKMRGQKLNFLNTWKRNPNSPQAVADAAREAAKTADDMQQEAADEALAFIQTLKAVADERPEFFDPLRLAYEFSDGDINTMGKLNEYIKESLPAIQKAVYDRRPDIPNAIVQGLYSNYYNSILTSASTPMKALVGNVGGMIAKPIAHIGGAAIGLDARQMQRGFVAYGSVLDSFLKGTKHMGKVFTMASKDPNSVSYMVRDDLAVRNQESMDLLKSFAEAASERGEDGPMALYQIAETLEDVGNNPILRFGANAMSAFDGFTRAVMANSRARMLAYDDFIDEGVKPTKEAFQAKAKEYYDSMFDSKGLIRNDYVDYATSEIALNLDTPRVRAFTNLIKANPWMKPFVLFPKTSANVVSTFGTYSPITMFMDDYKKIVFNTPLEGFTADELDKLMTPRGLKPTQADFDGLRAELRGKKAIGAAAIFGAFQLWQAGRIRGDGHFDPNRQRVRQEMGYENRTVMDDDGNWHSYEWLGPVGDWLAFTVNVMDNFTSISEPDLFLNKATFILGASLTNRDMFAGLEPMFDVIRADGGARTRWAGNFLSPMAPLHGVRRDLGRIISPGLKVVENELGAHIRNKNGVADLVDPENSLPQLHDWLYGDKVGYAENPFVRGWNAVMPMKIYEGRPRPEADFLMKIEYDTRPVFNVAENGVKYTAEEKAKLFEIMGKDGYFKDEIARLMDIYDADEWRDTIHGLRMKDGKDIDEKIFDNLYINIDAAAREAKKLAELRLPLEMQDDLQTRIYQAGRNAVDQKMGQAPRFDVQTMTNK
ncbi:internal virion protein [Synechococcus phage S-RIP2]|uniref:Internal virion protein n=2 Tax=Sednavirus SRIP2 TaxID=2733955 RepID=M4SQW7_9CAUD|nr:internal virion protein [Synechococcus phage S-RIP2]YP_007676327.1 internal virion protein [Cyanophage KBS-P-1A]AGG91307.1 hypothetical protein SWQG_00010 [Synechococcus phage S-RIP2]AGH57700.1 hypothetical protein CYZG_00005 [Cyanophage KBS-P-1A]